MRSVSIIGAGRVGLALALSLPPDNYCVTHLVHRGREMLDDVAGQLPGNVKIELAEEFTGGEADILIVAVQDPYIAAAADWAANSFDSVRYAYHTSGALQSGLLCALENVGASLGSVHPLVSISEPVSGKERFNGAYFCVEGEPDAVEIGRELVEALGGRPFAIDTRFKTLYHAAAVTACGHLVALLDASFEMLETCGVERDDAKRILMPLVTSTIANLSRQDTASAMTGTFARADVETFSKHVAAINELCSEEIMEIYLLLGERALELAAEKGANPERIETMRSRVAFARAKLR
ncbi:MAG: DUF2520 domain-containing protein [Acidobacteriota bacterium]|nr:MAG: DUF2520 domain-containing protein [Acidobacteriota bacterium]